jgi:hypothetical protein
VDDFSEGTKPEGDDILVASIASPTVAAAGGQWTGLPFATTTAQKFRSDDDA